MHSVRAYKMIFAVLYLLLLHIAAEFFSVEGKFQNGGRRHIGFCRM